MDIACSESESDRIGSTANTTITRRARMDSWGRWSRALRGGMVLLAALTMVSLPWSWTRPLARANTLFTAALLLVVGLIMLGISPSKNAGRKPSIPVAGRVGAKAPSSSDLLMILDSLSSLLGVWLILSPMVFSMPWPDPGLASALLGAGIFLVAEAGHLAELNHQIGPS